MPNFFYEFHFYLFGLISIAAAITFVTRKNPVAAALWLVVTMFALAALFVMLDAHFVGIIQILVYAGAIMVVFLFVVMLLNLGHPKEIFDARGLWWKVGASALGIVLLAQLATLVRSPTPASLVREPRLAAQELQQLGAVGTVAEPLFREHLLAFEITSVLLLVAIVGAVVLGKRRANP